MSRRLALLALCLGTAGCFHIHANEPRCEDNPVKKDPDPGEKIWVFTGGIFEGGGVQVGGGPVNVVSGYIEAGYEASARVGEAEVSHRPSERLVLPDTDFGVNAALGLGGSPGVGAPGFGGHLEAQLSQFGHGGLFTYRSISAGVTAYAFPDHVAIGPEVALTVGPFYLRFSQLFGQGVSISVGYVAKMLVSVVHARDLPPPEPPPVP